MKSLITALWERSAAKKRIDPINSEADSSMKFEVGAARERGCCRYILSENTTLSSLGCDEGGFGVYVAGNWRFELKVDPETGECFGFSGFMSKLTAKSAEISVPEAESKTLICKSEKLGEGSGCYCSCPNNSVLYDLKKKILCIGDPDAKGDAIEFLDSTVAVLANGRLCCIYLMLENIEEEAQGINLMNCIVTV